MTSEVKHTLAAHPEVSKGRAGLRYLSLSGLWFAQGLR